MPVTSVIFNPLEEYETKLKRLHGEHIAAFFEELVKKSGVDAEENCKTVQEYIDCKEHLSKLKRKLNFKRFLRVLMCISLVLIPVVVLKTTPQIKALREDVVHAADRAEELLALAYRQMEPLNSLFTDKDSLRLTEKTMPLLTFEDCFTAQQEADMKTNYDFSVRDSEEQSTLETLAGRYNGNPFLFENRLVHTMGTETYHGYKTITWTETYRDSNGHLQRRTRTQTLHATVTKPKPYYSTQVVLNYGSQGAPDLCFSRDAGDVDEKSERAIERHVKRGERKLKRLTDKAIAKGGDFMTMSNTEFEVLFDALDRNNEVQFRTLFTPLAQTNMVELLLSKTCFGDDFAFFKRKRMNKIVSKHSQGRKILVPPQDYHSYSFDIIQESFRRLNEDFFRDVYFDFAPLLAIPAYQERPVHSLHPVAALSQKYALKEHEALANALHKKYVVHPRTKTPAILKSDYLGVRDELEETCITAYSYDILQRVDIVPMWGGDGRLHNVSVPWDEYIALEAKNRFCIAPSEQAPSGTGATRNGLRIFPL